MTLIAFHGKDEIKRHRSSVSARTKDIGCAKRDISYSKTNSGQEEKMGYKGRRCIMRNRLLSNPPKEGRGGV